MTVLPGLPGGPPLGGYVGIIDKRALLRDAIRHDRERVLHDERASFFHDASEANLMALWAEDVRHIAALYLDAIGYHATIHEVRREANARDRERKRPNAAGRAHRRDRRRRVARSR